MWHHTASQTSPENDAAYIATGSPDAPLSNLLIARDGRVFVIAAGGTNTNGKGYSLRFTRGAVPNDQMNTHAVGMEIANNGVGETYPAAQIDAAFASSITICQRLGLDVADVANHWDWAPDRKIDCARASAASGFWPRSVNSSQTWALDDLRAECRARAGAPPIPPDPTPPDPTPPNPAPPESEDDMRLTTAADANGTIWIGDGMSRRAVPSEAVFSNYVVLSSAGASLLVNTSGQQVRQMSDVQTVGNDTIEALGVRVG